MTDLYTFFQMGSEYPAEQTIDVPRDTYCSSRAFSKSKNTVRPDDVTIEKLYEHTADFDVFYCHSPLPDGTYRVCANWFKEHGANLPRNAISEKEMNEVLNRNMP